MAKLEDVIKQKTFKSEQQRAFIHVMVTNSWLNEYQKDFFKNFNISKQQYNAMRILRGQFPSGLSVNSVKDRMLDKMPDTSRLVDRLVSKALVEREVNKTDRRATIITLTAKGVKLMDKIDQDIHQIETLFDNLNEEEAEELNRLLEKARNKRPLKIS
ncbi:MAG: MarR family multiple gene transcriptional regulator MgrA [Sphingobacteriales bacterium]|jgi:MarR family multiple gene transcriptional regulator MgrA